MNSVINKPFGIIDTTVMSKMTMTLIPNRYSYLVIAKILGGLSIIFKNNFFRSALGATALGDIIYVCGGYDGVTSLNSVERYHPFTNTWCSLAPMNKSRSAGAVIACQGFIYALGGHDGLSIFDSVERYDPSTNTWIEAAPMLTKRCRLGVAMLGGKLYACGGYDGSTFLQTVEVFNPYTNK